MVKISACFEGLWFFFYVLFSFQRLLLDIIDSYDLCLSGPWQQNPTAYCILWFPSWCTKIPRTLKLVSQKSHGISKFHGKSQWNTLEENSHKPVCPRITVFLSEKLTAPDQLRYGFSCNVQPHLSANISCIKMLHKIRLTKKTIWDSLEVRFHPANVPRFVDKGEFSRPQLVQDFWSKVKLVVVYLSVGSSPRNLQFDELTIWIPWTMSKTWKKIIRKKSIVVIWVQSHRFGLFLSFMHFVWSHFIVMLINSYYDQWLLELYT